MVRSCISVALQCLTLLGLSVATQASAAKRCAQLEVPVSVEAQNFIFDVPRVDSNVDAVDLAVQLDTWSSPNSTERILRPHLVKETFTIGAQLCVPSGSDGESVLQIATHGLWFDKRYWDAEVHPDKYSYVDAAIDAGYSILTYDRLGVGKSDKPDAYKVVQASAQLEILKELTVLVRAGKLLDVSKFCSGSQISQLKPSKVVHVGHSYGSILTSALIAFYGKLSDGAIVTGFIPNTKIANVKWEAMGFEFARSNDPSRFSDRGSGYIAQASVSNVQQIFLKKGTFQKDMLVYAEQIKQPASVGELVSPATVLGRPAPAFTGPLLFVLAELDFPICGGDCKGTYDLEELRDETYPNAMDVSDYIQPSSGHGLTLTTNAAAGYKAIFSYLETHGL